MMAKDHLRDSGSPQPNTKREIPQRVTSQSQDYLYDSGGGGGE